MLEGEEESDPPNRPMRTIKYFAGSMAFPVPMRGFSRPLRVSPKQVETRIAFPPFERVPKVW